MAKIIAILDSDSAGHKVRLSDGEVVHVPLNSAHSVSVGAEFEPPQSSESTATKPAAATTAPAAESKPESETSKVESIIEKVAEVVSDVVKDIAPKE